MGLISEKTVVPIGFVIVFLGGCLWLSRIWFVVEADAETSRIISIDQKKYTEHVEQIDRRLSRIEGKLGVGTGPNE